MRCVRDAERDQVKKILIVDDSVAEVKLMQSVLEQAGYWPVALQDARQLEAIVASERPNLILLDVVPIIVLVTVHAVPLRRARRCLSQC